MADFPSALGDALRDRYTLERLLRRGGMATVYLAGDLKHRRPLGRPDDVRAIHDELTARARREYVQPTILAITTASLGRLEEAFLLLHRACDEHDGVLMYSRSYPGLRLLQSDQRMAEIYRRIGFPGV